MSDEFRSWVERFCRRRLSQQSRDNIEGVVEMFLVTPGTVSVGALLGPSDDAQTAAAQTKVASGRLLGRWVNHIADGLFEHCLQMSGGDLALVHGAGPDSSSRNVHFLAPLCAPDLVCYARVGEAGEPDGTTLERLLQKPFEIAAERRRQGRECRITIVEGERVFAPRDHPARHGSFGEELEFVWQLHRDDLCPTPMTRPSGSHHVVPARWMPAARLLGSYGGVDLPRQAQLLDSTLHLGVEVLQEVEADGMSRLVLCLPRPGESSTHFAGADRKLRAATLATMTATASRTQFTASTDVLQRFQSTGRGEAVANLMLAASAVRASKLVSQ